MNQKKVLCVDDEPQVLEGLALHLRRRYEVVTAKSGAKGLQVLEQSGPFTIVLSDMRMPGMDGAAFLAEVRKDAPDTIRMLLTGHADLQAAIAAVNEGQIFRFLTKPCPSEQLLKAFDAATEQHRLITAERVLLEQTLHGSIKTLIDILSLTNPVAFGRSTRIKQHVSELAEKLRIQDRWQVEVAAMLSQLGGITLPEETAERFYYGKELSNEEQAMVSRLPEVTEELLSNIPRLEPVREILARKNKPFEGAGDTGRDKNEIPIGARLLKIAVDFDEFESRGLSVQLVLDTMRSRKHSYDPEILEAFISLKGSTAEQQEVKEIPLQAVRVGMVFAEDVHTQTGMLLVTRGYEVTPGFIERTKNFSDSLIKEPLRVIVQSQEDS